MSTNKKNTDTSIELVSNNGSLPINVMMQEGVKALTTILSSQLQDRKAFDKAQHSMQFVIRDNGKRLIDNSKKDNSKVIDSNNNHVITTTTATRNIDDKYNNDSNVNKSKKTLSTDKSEVHELMNEDFLNPDLHLDGEEAEIIFDYETHDASPDAIGKRISEMIESVLPNGFPADSQGQLHAIINGNELSITELDNNTVASLENNKHKILSNQDHTRIEELVNDTRQYETTSNIGINNIGSEDEGNDNLNDEEDIEHDVNNHPFDHEACCPHHSINSNHRASQRFKNYNYHDFEYIPKGTNVNNKRPDFAVLIDRDKPMCMFCEYYLVFGEPPKNMIKWYNNMFGYNRLPPSSNRDRHQHNQNHQQYQQQQGHRKRNR